MHRKIVQSYKRRVGRPFSHSETGWLEVALKFGDPIPEPAKTGDFFEKLLLPLPKLLYQKITEQAHAEGISLNQHILQKLSQ
ncbi:MAG: toxin-antitoxin system HicB family antitoxin [Defluviitaleaceae bacterium]|nr:toxin-antitoxin system HicB family antitoxin [Defluviitaleaceae bacterium]